MASPWSNEIWRLATWLGSAWLLGFVLGKVTLTLALALLAYLALHLYQLNRLVKWLSGKLPQVPEARGIWSEIFFRIYRIAQHNRKRKQRLVDILTRFRESTAAMPDATVVLQGNGEIVWMNKASATLLNLHSPADIGQRIGNLLRHPKFSQYLLKQQFEKPVEMPSPSNEYCTLSIIIIPYGKEQLLLIARDVTQLHKLEQIRRDFVANASHELRTPLTVLSGMVETLDEYILPSKDRTRAVKLMRQQSYRMEQIVTDLLLLTQLEADYATTKQPVAVPALIQTLIDEAKTLGGEIQHDIRVEISAELWLMGDENEIRSAFMNLLSNAVRYTADGGRISVRWRLCGNEACFEVEDSGIGIAEHHIERLTERFYRVDVGRSRRTGGTGLGLAIVKHVLDRCGARLEIKSQIGKGSIFRCHFPSPIYSKPTQPNRRQHPQQQQTV